MSLEKNGEYTGEVSALGTEGEGIINTDGATAFVPFCLPREVVRFKALKVKDGIVYGKAEEISVRSPDRAEPCCPLFTKCGGCDLQHMTYAAQLAFKKTLVENTLKKIAGVSAPVGETVFCESPLRYRNKLALPIGRDANGRTVLGFYARRSHRIVPASDCPIQSEWIKDIIAAVLKYAEDCNLSGYDEVTRKGELRQIVVREIKGKFIIALVVTKKIDVSFLIKELEKSFENFTFLLNVNPFQGNVIFSKEWRICRGEGRFEAEEYGIKFSAGAETFLQVNDGVRNKLYARVLREVSPNVTAVDLYSGGGLLTAMLAKNCRAAYGVEVVREASLCAEELCAKNGLQGRMFNICGKVEEELSRVLSAVGGPKIVVSDPPRKGMERSVCEKLAVCGADKLVLVSCNPATLARDLKIILGESRNYEIESITPFDMFPQTRHVETVVVLGHK